MFANVDRDCGVDVGSTPLKAPLPSFLQPRQLPHQQTHPPVPVHATYTHKRPFGQAQVLWWPWPWGTPDRTVIPRTVLLFIPGVFHFPFSRSVLLPVRGYCGGGGGKP